MNIPATLNRCDCSVGWSIAFLLLPWLSPYTTGPTPNTWPLMLSALCVVFLWIYPTRLEVRFVAAAWLMAAVISTLIGLIQYFGLAQFFNPWISQADVGQAFANLRQRNQFATLTSIGLAALVGLLALRLSHKSLPSSQQCQQQIPQSHRLLSIPWWAYLSAFLLALGNAASSSRTGLLQWLLIPLLTARCLLPGRWRLLAFALLTYGVALVLLPWLLVLATGLENSGLFGRLTQDTVCASRLTLWSNVLHLIAQKPWFGWGWGELDYAHYMTLDGGPRFCDILDNAHNLPLHLAVELGVPFALLVCGSFVWWVWRQRPWRESDPDRQLAWSVIALILLHSMLEYPLWYGPFQMAFGFCLLILWRTRKTAAETGFFSKYALNSRIAHILRAFIATILIALLLYAAWDYHRISQIYLVAEEREPAYRQNTLAKIRSSWLFSDQVQFAELMLTPLTRDNAQWTFDSASALLHFSPEPRVIEKVIESAVFLGRDEDAMVQMVHYRTAFPEAYTRWLPTRTLNR